MAELTAAGVEAVAVEGAVKQFDVAVGGALVFSKQREGRFPEAGEALRLVLAV